MDFDYIETASEEKDLGVTFQQDKFSSQMAEKVNKANSTHIILNTVELWSLELACLEHQASLELVRPSRQLPYTFNVKILPRLEQRWLQLSNTKHSPQGDFSM